MHNKLFGLALGFVITFGLSGCGAARLELDNEQGRLDRAAPLVQGSRTVGQTFLSHYPRLTAIEVLLVVQPRTTQEVSRLTFHLRRSLTSESDIASLTLDTAGLQHNQPQRFVFPPLADSENQSYYFFLEGTPSNHVTVWSNSIDAYGAGSMVVDGVPQPGDLQFKTYYDYDLRMLAADLVRGISHGIPAFFPLLAIFVFPGYLVLSLWAAYSEVYDIDPIEHIAMIIGLSMAIVPLVFLLTSIVRFKITRDEVVAAAIIQGIMVVFHLWKTRLAQLRRWSATTYLPISIGFVIVLIVTAALRYLHIRNLVVPAWVDGVHHTLITQLIVNWGGIPESYAPYLNVNSYVYHFGFHTLAAAFTWLMQMDAPDAVLVVGQVVNTLMVFGIYLLTKRLSGSATAGLVSAIVVGVISLMPAYYVSWGRYTQLTGLALLPAVFVFTQDALEASCLRWRNFALAGLAIAGLTVTHYRVLVFFSALVVAYLLVETVARRVHVKYLWGRALLLATLSIVLAAPWLVRVITTQIGLGRLVGWFQGSASFNAVPWSLVDVGLNRVLMVWAGLGLGWGIWRRARIAMLTLIWTVLLVVTVNPNLFGFSSMWLINNSSLVISLFVPLALLVGDLFGALSGIVGTRLPDRWQPKIVWGGIIAVVVVTLWGASGMLSVVNPATVLATRDDVAAMQWIRQNVSPDARFLINVRLWQEGSYMGTDGGYWIPLLAQRQTVMPPAIYVQGSKEYINEINEIGRVVSSAQSFDDPNLQKLIEEYRITHVYLGARGGTLTPQMLLHDRRVHMLYSDGTVWIFELDSIS